MSPGADDRFLEQLAAPESVVGLSLNRGASLKPPGDGTRVYTLNRGADAV